MPSKEANESDLSMQKKSPGIIDVNIGVAPSYLQSVLTKDISPMECVYDLVDNSVDAIRDCVMSTAAWARDPYGLPASYHGHTVNLSLKEQEVAISDDGTGIATEILSSRALVTGAFSEHRFGIGRFGLGLKRALLKLGERYEIKSDTGETAFVLNLSKRELSGSGIWHASKFYSKRSRFTSVRVSDLSAGIWHELGSANRLDEVRKNLSRRYGLYIRKGLRLTLNGTPVPDFGPQIRQIGPIHPSTHHTRSPEGVDIYIDSGMHEHYRLTSERGYDRALIASLTDQFGWYFVCNDRIVKAASHDNELGWTGRWHQEYYGFVGWVRFVAESPEALPWDTKKTVIDSNSDTFRHISRELQSFADSYKVENKRARPNAVPQSTTSSSRAQGPKSKGRPSAPHSKPSASQRPGIDNMHNEHWSTLLPRMGVTVTDHKLGALVAEAESLGLEHSYSGSLLFRALIERALFIYIKSTGNYGPMVNSHVDAQAKNGRPLSEEQRKGYRPTLLLALNWFSNQCTSNLPDEIRHECAKSAARFGSHLKELNGVAHEANLTNSAQLQILRDDSMPFLKFLLEESGS